MLDLSDIKNKLTGNHTIVVVCIVAFILLFVACPYMFIKLFIMRKSIYPDAGRALRN